MMKEGYTSKNNRTHQQYVIYTPSAISGTGNKCNVPATISPVFRIKGCTSAILHVCLCNYMLV